MLRVELCEAAEGVVKAHSRHTYVDAHVADSPSLHDGQGQCIEQVPPIQSGPYFLRTAWFAVSRVPSSANMRANNEVRFCMADNRIRPLS